MPEGDADFATRWRLIKSTFSRNLSVDEPISESRAAKRERGIWQRRYWEHTIRDEDDFARHVDYIHINPLKHGVVDRAREWEASSFQRYVKLGFYPIDWAGDASQDGRLYGERLWYELSGFATAQPILRARSRLSRQRLDPVQQ